MIDDQRHHLRLPAHALECTTDLQRTPIINLGEGGLCLLLGAPVRVREAVRIRCHLAVFNSFFEVTGEVVWTDASSGRAGVRFVSVPELLRARLIEWLFQNAVAACADTSATHEARAENGWMASAAPEVDAVLHLMATRARLVTRADGAAIALAEGDAMLCRANSGDAAPTLGMRPDVESGLTTECLRTGRIVVCADAETDSRQALANCRALGVRSAIVMPLQKKARIFGLLGVFSARPYAFDSYDIDTLKRMAASVVAASLVEHAEARLAAAA